MVEYKAVYDSKLSIRQVFNSLKVQREEKTLYHWIKKGAVGCLLASAGK
jgi:predicted site-specific integrase-resolvase